MSATAEQLRDEGTSSQVVLSGAAAGLVSRFVAPDPTLFPVMAYIQVGQVLHRAPRRPQDSLTATIPLSV